MLKQWIQNPDLGEMEVEEKYKSWVESLRTDRYVTVQTSTDLTDLSIDFHVYMENLFFKVTMFQLEKLYGKSAEAKQFISEVCRGVLTKTGNMEFDCQLPQSWDNTNFLLQEILRPEGCCTPPGLRVKICELCFASFPLSSPHSTGTQCGESQAFQSFEGDCRRQCERRTIRSQWVFAASI